MPTTSRGLRYPSGNASPAVYLDIQNLATDLNDKIVPRYTSTAARNTAIPAPVANDAAIVNGQLTLHDGTRWATAVNGLSGNGGGTTDASGNITTTHGLGATPSRVFIQPTTGAIQGIAQYVWTAASATTFTVTLYNSTTGAAINGNPSSFSWLAVY